VKAEDDTPVIWTAVSCAMARCNARYLQQAMAKPRTQEAREMNIINNIGAHETTRKW
jgi:hypothetical protein